MLAPAKPPLHIPLPKRFEGDIANRLGHRVDPKLVAPCESFAFEAVCRLHLRGSVRCRDIFENRAARACQHFRACRAWAARKRFIHLCCIGSEVFDLV